ncbi:MAG: glycosyltransferase [Phycisphaerales bacterium JB063]
MQVLYVAQQYDYGQPEAGHGFEHYNFYQSLCAMGLDVAYFDYPTLHQQLGHRAMNRRLWEVVRADRPALLFGIVRRDLIDTAVMRRISHDTDTTTVNWFCDDHWQFETHARRWAPCFNWSVTTSHSAFAKYRALPGVQAIQSQWACNPDLYRPIDLPKQYDVSFVGQPYGRRRSMIEALEHAGLRVNTWGKGWPAGKIGQDEMIRVFNQSRVNLNFSEASSPSQSRIEALFRGRWVQATKTMPGLWRVWDQCHQRVVEHKRRAALELDAMPRQIKGRNFEVPACGGYLLTEPAEQLETYYTPDRHIGLFNDTEQLIEQVRAALRDPDERERTARDAYEHTLAHHTWQHRFRDILARVGLTARTRNTRHRKSVAA